MFVPYSLQYLLSHCRFLGVHFLTCAQCLSQVLILSLWPRKVNKEKIQLAKGEAGKWTGIGY